MFCPSPATEGSLTPCGRPTIGDSHHCEQHANMLRPHYLKYKSFNIDHILDAPDEELMTAHPRQLLKHISKLERNYELRIHHRKLAFVPSLWDRGHDIYIERCINMIFKIRDILVDMFACNAEDTSDTDSTDSPVEFTPEEVASIDKTIDTIIETEADWGDSEAIKTYQENLQKIIISFKIIKDMFRRIFKNLTDEQLTPLTTQFIYYVMAMHILANNYIKYPNKYDKGFTCTAKIRYHADIVLCGAKGLLTVLPPFIKMCCDDFTAFKGIFTACLDRNSDFIFRAPKITGREVSNYKLSTKAFKISIAGARHSAYIVQANGTYNWSFDGSCLEDGYTYKK